MQTEAYVKAGFGEAAYHNATNVHPTGMVVLLFAMAFTLGCRRSLALLPLFVVSFLLPSAQRVVVAGLDFSFPRLLLLALAVRALSRGEWRLGRLNEIDRAFLAWAICAAAGYVLRKASTGALIYKLGSSYDLLGLYFLTRNYLASPRDAARACTWLALIAALASVFFAVEKSTGRNLFSIFGGAPEFTRMREGRLRCQGPYVHPILAGCLWAGAVPLFWGQLRTSRQAMARLRAGLGIAGCLVIIVACASSTPLLGLLAAAAFLTTWRIRARIPLVRSSVLAGLVVIHFIRNRPVWQLIAMAGVVGGSTGYHRYQLVDAFIRHWPEWFLLGSNSTAHWGHFLFDLANQFVREGVEAGFLALLAFCVFLVRCFSKVGSLVRGRRTPPRTRYMAWAVGCALAAHCVMFIGISISHSPPNILGFLLPAALLPALGRGSQGLRREASGHAESDPEALVVS